MKPLLLILALSVALACDTSSPNPVTLRQDTSTSDGDPDGTGETGCPVEPVAAQPPTAWCACNLGDPDTCALGLDCVPFPANSKTGRCFAKAFGELAGSATLAAALLPPLQSLQRQGVRATLRQFDAGHPPDSPGLV